MKNGKRILALAIGLAGGLASPGVFAAASLYGQLNVSLDSLDNGTDSALNISSNSSRLGVKGDIQIGGDIAGIYQIESELRADTAQPANNGVLATRNTFVGLQGGFGVARLGRFDTPVKVIGRKVDLFGDQVGDARNLTRAAGGINRFDERPNNSIDYTSPTRGGIQGTLLYSTNTDTAVTATNDNDLLSLGVNYAQGPLFVGVGYEAAGNATAGQEDPNIVRLGAYYDLDAWRFSGLWQAISGAATDGSQDEDVYGFGVRYKAGAWAFKGQIYQLSAEADERDAGLVALGAEYALQKGITLYAAYAGTDNDDGRAVTPYSEGRSDNLAVAASGDSARALSLGTIIKF